jgi:hypothetical protein
MTMLPITIGFGGVLMKVDKDPGAGEPAAAYLDSMTRDQWADFMRQTTTTMILALTTSHAPPPAATSPPPGPRVKAANAGPG